MLSEGYISSKFVVGTFLWQVAAGLPLSKMLVSRICNTIVDTVWMQVSEKHSHDDELWTAYVTTLH